MPTKLLSDQVVVVTGASDTLPGDSGPQVVSMIARAEGPSGHGFVCCSEGLTTVASMNLTWLCSS
ncbi:MAG TPA: hypothetical protein VLZ09_03665 [Gaiellaceae bacterium]|nr:hypothetical protein [Gaiellaceae bacterium]